MESALRISRGEGRDYSEILHARRDHHLPPLGRGSDPARSFQSVFRFPRSVRVRIKRALEPYGICSPRRQARYNLAYFFDYDFDGKGAVEQRFQPLQAELSRWKETHRHAHLPGGPPHRRGDRGARHASRNTTARLPGYRFRGPEKSILDFIDTTHSFTAIHEHLVQRMNGAAPGEGWLHGFLDYLVNHRLALRDGDRYLSVILPTARQEPEGW